MSRPSGHFDKYGVIPVAPDPPKHRETAADLAVLVKRNEGRNTPKPARRQGGSQ